MIKTFRGLMADGTQDTISLHTNNGSTGYRMVKFEIISNTPGIGDVDHVVKVYTVSQSAITATINFADNELIGAAFLFQDADASNITARYAQHIFFDNMTFNQDIFVTLENARGSSIACNYLIELEQVKLDISESTVATLKDIRNRKRTATG